MSPGHGHGADRSLTEKDPPIVGSNVAHELVDLSKLGWKSATSARARVQRAGTHDILARRTHSRVGVIVSHERDICFEVPDLEKVLLQLAGVAVRGRELLDRRTLGVVILKRE